MIRCLGALAEAVSLPAMIRGVRPVFTETFDGEECVEPIARGRAAIIHGFDTPSSTSSS